MASIPEYIADAWQARSGPAVLSTISEDGTPNTIYTAYIDQYGNDAFVITDHFFNKTRDNILRGSKGSLLFLTENGKLSYQLKGSFEYLQQGAMIEEMRQSMPSGMPCRAAVIFKIHAVYAGGDRLA